MELIRLISIYAALYVLMMCGFIKRSKMKPWLRTSPAYSTSVLRREIVCRYCKVVLTEADDKKRTDSVLLPDIFDKIVKWTDQVWVSLRRFGVIELYVVCEHFVTNRTLFDGACKWCCIHYNGTDPAQSLEKHRSRGTFFLFFFRLRRHNCSMSEIFETSYGLYHDCQSHVWSENEEFHSR